MKKGKKKPSFRTKLIFLTLSACIISTLILGIAQMVLSVFHFSRQARSDLEFYLENTSGQFDTRIKNMENMVISLRHNNVLKHFIAGEAYNEQEAREQFANSTDLFSEMNMVDSASPFIDCIYLFNENGEWVSSRFYPETVENMELQNQIYKEINSSFLKSSNEYWYMTHDERAHVCMRVYNEEMEESGCCIISLGKSAVDTLFSKTKEYPESSWLITGEKGQILFANEKGKEQAKQMLEIQDLGSSEEKIGNQMTLFYGGKTGFGIELRMALPKNLIYASIRSTVQPFAVIFLIVIGITAIVVFAVSMRMTRPLKFIGEDIRKFGNGRLDAQMREFDTREFDEISTRFNEMTGQIKNLITEVYEKQLLATQAQVKYLQSQINPHFMFNILSMLSMKAGLQGNKELQKLLSAFSRLIQGKIFRNGEIEIPLFQEMELIEFYLLLQGERFAGKITYDILCSEEVKNARIPRLSVEPLVENAVSHGLEPKPGSGHIRVEAKEENGKLRIQIKDDGVGFDVEEQKKNKGQAVEDEKHTHIGLTNTQQMLHTIYGEEASMKIESTPGAGTCVTMCLPLEKGGRKSCGE